MKTTKTICLGNISKQNKTNIIFFFKNNYTQICMSVKCGYYIFKNKQTKDIIKLDLWSI